MKIGVITFWNSNDNYGQLLQLWALQQWLKKNGHSPYVINYSPMQTKKRKDYKYYFKIIIKVLLIYPIYRKYIITQRNKKYEILKRENDIKNKQRKFDDFRKNNIIFSSNKYHSLYDLQKNPPKADLYITGSDQVWAQLLNQDNNRAYFLDFGPINIKRISYAPSFSMLQYPKKLLDKLHENLARFDALSVREKTGVEICKIAGYKATLVCDPTLLIRQQEYLNIADNHISKNNYIYIYSLNIGNPEDIRWSELKSFSSIQNLCIKVTTASGYIPARELFGDSVEYDYSTIPEWLNNIRNAELLVTPSFHGVVFAILMHTSFIYVPLKGRFEGGNSRITDLLEDLNLTNRILKEDTTFDYIYNLNIDWNDVDKNLSIIRQRSESFLKNIL